MRKSKAPKIVVGSNLCQPIWAINHIEFTGAESKTDWNIPCYDGRRFFWVIPMGIPKILGSIHSTIINQVQFLEDQLPSGNQAWRGGKSHGKSHESSIIFPVKAPCGIDTGDIPSLPCWQRRAYQKWFWKITCFTMFYLNHLYINGYFPYLHLPSVELGASTNIHRPYNGAVGH